MNEPVRDPRWEEMYASIKTYTLDLDDKQVEFVRFGFYVWWNGEAYWTEQTTTKDMIKGLDFDIVLWLLNEMVKIMDEYLDGTRT